MKITNSQSWIVMVLCGSLWFLLVAVGSCWFLLGVGCWVLDVLLVLMLMLLPLLVVLLLLLLLWCCSVRLDSPAEAFYAFLNATFNVTEKDEVDEDMPGLLLSRGLRRKHPIIMIPGTAALKKLTEDTVVLMALGLMNSSELQLAWIGQITCSISMSTSQNQPVNNTGQFWLRTVGGWQVSWRPQYSHFRKRLWGQTSMLRIALQTFGCKKRVERHWLTIKMEISDKLTKRNILSPQYLFNVCFSSKVWYGKLSFQTSQLHQNIQVFHRWVCPRNITCWLNHLKLGALQEDPLNVKLRAATKFDAAGFFVGELLGLGQAVGKSGHDWVRCWSSILRGNSQWQLQRALLLQFPLVFFMLLHFF